MASIKNVKVLKKYQNKKIGILEKLEELNSQDIFFRKSGSQI